MCVLCVCRKLWISRKSCTYIWLVKLLTSTVLVLVSYMQTRDYYVCNRICFFCVKSDDFQNLLVEVTSYIHRMSEMFVNVAVHDKTCRDYCGIIKINTNLQNSKGFSYIEESSKIFNTSSTACPTRRCTTLKSFLNESKEILKGYI